MFAKYSADVISEQEKLAVDKKEPNLALTVMPISNFL